MTRIRQFFVLLAVALAAGCARPSYIGQSYNPTDRQPEVFVDWRDVPCDYETMGYATVYADGYSFGFGNDANAQQKLEAMAREKGADALVIAPPESEPQRQQVDAVEQKNDGSMVHTTTVTQRETRISGKLTAAFIKYKR